MGGPPASNISNQEDGKQLIFLWDLIKDIIDKRLWAVIPPTRILKFYTDSPDTMSREFDKHMNFAGKSVMKFQVKIICVRFFLN